MNIMIWISCVILCAYIAWILIKYKYIPNSLSSTYYKTNKACWFSITMILMTVLMMIPLFDISDDNWTFLVFLSCGSNIMCAAAPNFREDLEGPIHYISAFIAGIASQIWCELHNPLTLPIWCGLGMLLLIAYVIEKRGGPKSNITFWSEIFCFFNIYLTYILLN